MFSAVRWMLSKLVSPLWRTAEVDGDGGFPCASDMGDVRRLQGVVVTELCLDYGMIDHVVYFTSGDVLGRTPLKEGDSVNCIAVRDGVQGGWKALRVEKNAEVWEDGVQTSLEADGVQLHPLIGTVTAFDGRGGYINQTTCFQRSSLQEGYEPMKGDWVQAMYFIQPSQWTTEAQSVAPLRYCRLDQVRVTSLFGKNGVVDDGVFFCLDSLLLPANYRPLQGHLVNLVMLESNQSLYTWRALCMAPCCPQSTISVADTPLPEVVIKNLLENKGGLDVTDYGQFGHLMIGKRRDIVFWIQNKSSQVYTLKSWEFAGWDSEEQFILVKVNEPTPPRREQQRPQQICSISGSALEPSEEQGSGSKDMEDGEALGKAADIKPGERMSIVVGCLGKSLGTCVELLFLNFCSFTIGRRLEVTVGSEEESLLLPTVPYMSPDAQPLFRLATHVISVSTPNNTPRPTKRYLPSYLGNYPVPQALRDCVEAQSDVLVAEPCLREALSPDNMYSRFSALLWLEELQAEREVKEFTIHGALLKKGAGYLHLEILGLAEGRPSVNIGDRVVLKKSLGGDSVVEYTCYVAEINDENVSLKVNSDLHRNYIGEPFDVEFSYNRLTMRRCHYAVQHVKHFKEILFPTRLNPQPPLWTGTWTEETDQEVSSISVDMKSKATQTKGKGLLPKPIPSKGHFFNPNLNPAQREAVKRIVEGVCRPIPFVLFGPPGTGKTITLIEAILQVYYFLPSSRVLVCTPSNSAADLICIRLHGSGFLCAGSLARVNATYRQVESIPEELKPYSKAGEDIRQAVHHRIVVSTCSSAAMFHNIGLQVGHFTHVFLDEAGQATEPESMIPISFISERNGQIVLAGDPCQLGPVVKSKLASVFGLGVSLLERLMSNTLYNRNDWGYNPEVVTKLIYNYRSHEALLTLPSKLFYKGELCAKASKATVEVLCHWKKLPKKGFPLFFHGVRGTEMREGTNPSWFNPVEAVQVMLYSCQLAKKLYKPVDAADIGIIAPYRKQCEKIRMLLHKVGLSDIKVGSVEEFQGQEFLVIILSTVRSNESAPSEALQNVLGFLANPKRFNVAITRPKALLIIVGNPHVLIHDPCFRALLQYCFGNGAFLGCDPPPSLRDSCISDEPKTPDDDHHS